jgi:hypothetical protein
MLCPLGSCCFSVRHHHGRVVSYSSSAIPIRDIHRELAHTHTTYWLRLLVIDRIPVLHGYVTGGELQAAKPTCQHTAGWSTRLVLRVHRTYPDRWSTQRMSSRCTASAWWRTSAWGQRCGSAYPSVVAVSVPCDDAVVDVDAESRVGHLHTLDG